MKKLIDKYLIFNLFLTASCLMCFVSFTLAQTPEGDDAWRLAQSAPAVHSVSNPVNSADLAKKGLRVTLRDSSVLLPSGIRQPSLIRFRDISDTLTAFI